MPDARECGECQACCHALLIHDPPSETGADCRHQGATGCEIYVTRPSACRAWSCSWLIGRSAVEAPWGTAEQRPDKLGLVFSSQNASSAIARESQPTAARAVAGEDAIADWLLEVRTVFIFRHGSTTDLCDDWRPRRDPCREAQDLAPREARPAPAPRIDPPPVA